MLVIVLGLPGSGKSFFAKALAKRLDAAYVSSDRMRNTVGARGKYSKEEKMQIYHLMREETGKHASAGKKVVVDGTFYLTEMIDLFKTLSPALATPIYFMSVVADEKLIKERLSSPRDDSEADYDVYLNIKEKVEPLQIPHLTLRSGRDNIDEMISAAMDYIRDAKDE